MDDDDDDDKVEIIMYILNCVTFSINICVILFNRFTKTVKPIYSYLIDDNLHVTFSITAQWYALTDLPIINRPIRTLYWWIWIFYSKNTLLNNSWDRMDWMRKLCKERAQWSSLDN